MKNLSFFRHGVQVLYLICLGLFINSPIALAHNTVPLIAIQQLISGTVTDSNGPLPSVTIAVKGSNAITISDQNGRYSVAALATDTLIFSFVGYKTIEVPLDGRLQFNALLTEDFTTLQEVSVNAGYYTVKDKERTGSISTIKAADIEGQPVSNVLATMQGRMAGVDVSQDNGMAGGGFQIRIRGINSLRADGNEPLYIIDGVPFSSESIGSPNTSGVFITQTNPLSSINPSTIASIDILKDADATAIYGSRGANGVVLITTKRGTAGKTKFTAEASTGIAKVGRFARLLNTKQYVAMRLQGYENDQQEPPFWASDVNGDWDLTRETDWQRELIGGTAEIRAMQTSISGGSENTTFSLSGNYRTETTVMPGDFKYEKGGIHASINHIANNKKLKVAFSAGYTSQRNNQPGIDLTLFALTLAPNAPALYDDEGNINWEDGTWTNPLSFIESKFMSRTNNLTANSVLTYSILPDLQIKGSFGYNDVANDELTTQPSTAYNPAWGLDSSASGLETNQTGIRSWIAEPQLLYKRTFGKNTLDALLGATYQSQRSNRLFAGGYGFASNSQIYDLASANDIIVYRSDVVVYNYQAFFGRINYQYDSKYFINATGRRDGSSRFGLGNQFANFGAVGVAWVFTNESFFKDHAIFSFGKLRGSYGITGNDQIGDYQYLDTYTSTGVSYENSNGLAPSRLYNPAFGWETNRKAEIALETGFFKDRIFLTSAYYVNRSSDQLVGIPLPATTGFTSLTANLGATVENRGFEFTLRTQNFTGTTFSWSTNFNISANRNTLLSFPGLEGSTYANTYVVGESIHLRKLYHYTGINAQTGIYEFEDVDGDGSISPILDRNKSVDLTPKYFGGLQNQFTYKGFQFDFLFQFVKQKRFEFNTGAPGTSRNQLNGNSEGWTGTGSTSLNQILTGGFNEAATEAFDRFSASDGAVTDGSFIKLRNVSVSYDLPVNALKCRVFIQGQNLFTFTKYKGLDPEYKFAGQLPPLRIITAGAQIQF